MSCASSAAGKLNSRSSATGVARSAGISVSARPAWPLTAAGVSRLAVSIVTSSKVSAAIHSAVTEDSTRPSTATRAMSVCKRPSSGPRRRVNQRRQPPVRRATSTAPERASSSIASAPVATIQRPPSPRKSERCRLVSQRRSESGSALATSRPVAGLITAEPGWSPSNHHALICPEGARLICSRPGCAACTRAARSATVSVASGCTVRADSSAGNSDSAAPLSAVTSSRTVSTKPSQRCRIRIIAQASNQRQSP